MDKTYTQTLADFAVKTGFSELPEEVVHVTKRIILDTLGCTVGGYSNDMGKMAVALISTP
ncbi:MmgE/PrpD family protein [Chloroflexota bacterium]